MLCMFWRRLLRIAIGGVVCALLVLATGWLVQRIALGVDDAGMRMKVEAEVRSAFDRMARRLRTMAAQTSDLSTIRAALDGDTSAVRRLLTSTAAVISEDAPFDPALTIYSDDGEPMAWAGRPSDLPSDRLQGDEAWFVSPSAAGLRLMYVRPVVDNGARVATLAVTSTFAIAMVPLVSLLVTVIRRGSDRFDVAFLRDVTPKRQRRVTELGCRLVLPPAQVDSEYTRTFAHEEPRRGTPDPRSRPRDHGHLAVEFTHRALLLVVSCSI